jgi:hypothetical protein
MVCLVYEGFQGSATNNTRYTSPRIEEVWIENPPSRGQVAQVLLLAMTAPQDLRSLTPEWLTEALRDGAHGRDSEVTSFRAERLGVEQGWVGEVARLDLSYAEAAAGLPSSVVVKFSPRDSDGVFSLHEANFYHEIAAGHDFAVPACYYAAENARTGESVLLLEDLSRLRTVSFLDGCTPREAEAAVMALARIHVSWWCDESLERKDWMLSIASTDFSNWWAQYPERIRSILPDIEISRRLMDFGDRFANDTPLVLDRIEGEPFTAIHRDIHVDNLLFGADQEDPPVILIDWQTAGRGKGISDIAYLLISSLSPSDRRDSEGRFIDWYHRYLVESGIEDYSLEQCWSDYKLGVASKLFITVTATVRFDNTSPHRRAWRRADLGRLMAFIEDHNPIMEL